MYQEQNQENKSFPTHPIKQCTILPLHPYGLILSLYQSAQIY